MRKKLLRKANMNELFFSMGFKVGFKQGIIEGRLEKALEIAKKLIASGMDSLEISEIVGLPLEEINSLAK